MKKLNQLYLALALILSMGLASCSNDDDKISEGHVATNTYVSLAIQMPKSNLATRADESSGEVWLGRDKIEKVTVYMVNEGNNTVSPPTEIKIASIADNEVLVTTKATAGAYMQAYVVINDVNDVLKNHIDTTSADAFKNSYTEAVKAVVSDLAETVRAGEAAKDIILMTNSRVPVAKRIERGVSVDDTKAADNPKNRFNVNVSRVVSRAIVTVKTENKEQLIPVSDNNDQGTGLIKVTEIKYSVGQVNKTFNLIKKDGVTPLVEELDNSMATTYTLVESIQNISAVNDALEAEKDSAKYVLPLVRESYLKGNTTYLEVRAKFQVQSELADGGQHDGKSTVYLGKHDGKFYASKNEALRMGDAELTDEQIESGKHNQRVYTYKNAEMVYVLWLNPDNEDVGDKIEESPVVRNQVYHAHITGFKKIGVSYNPLNPDDPSKPTDPTHPTEPINPIEPEDKLTAEDNYLSVKVKLLPWEVKSYGSDLGQDY